MVRLAIMFRRPIAEVLAWPSHHIRLILAFLMTEPCIEARIEQGIARLSAQHANANLAEGSQPRTITDYLPFARAWQPPEPSILDLQIDARLNRLGKD